MHHGQCWVAGLHPEGSQSAGSYVSPEEHRASGASTSCCLPCRGLACQHVGVRASPQAVPLLVDGQTQKTVFPGCLQHSPEFVMNSEPCPPLLCPGQAVSKLPSSCWLAARAQAQRHRAHEPWHRARAASVPKHRLQVPQPSEVAPGAHKHSRLRSLVTSPATKIHSATRTLCSTEPRGQ